MAWSCSEWLGENSPSNEAAQGVASLLLRTVCVCLRRQLCNLAYIGMLLSHTYNNRYLLCQRQGEKGLFFKKKRFDGTNNNNKVTNWFAFV